MPESIKKVTNQTLLPTNRLTEEAGYTDAWTRLKILPHWSGERDRERARQNTGFHSSIQIAQLIETLVWNHLLMRKRKTTADAKRVIPQ